MVCAPSHSTSSTRARKSDHVITHHRTDAPLPGHRAVENSINLKEAWSSPSFSSWGGGTSGAHQTRYGHVAADYLAIQFRIGIVPIEVDDVLTVRIRLFWFQFLLDPCHVHDKRYCDELDTSVKPVVVPRCGFSNFAWLTFEVLRSL